MKKNILLLVLILFCTKNAFSLEEKSGSKTYYAYCTVYGGSLDFGLSEKYWLDNESALKNNKGKLIKFKYFEDSLNYMQTLGWELAQVYSSPYHISDFNGDINSARTGLLRKKVTKEQLDQINAATEEKLRD